ncbi:MAG TPA: hypothetical protein VMS76_07870 [Planctomycetota bacterium]|nr:hypothetical protein [Planctomycetota bacterium]
MKRNFSLVLLLVAALACGSSFAQGPDEADLAARVAKLEAQVAALQDSLKASKPEGDKLGKDLAEQTRMLSKVLDYLRAQAASAKVLQDALAESQDKGFTFGINPESRVVLLAGFEQFVGTLQAEVPGQAPAEPAEPPPAEKQ